MRWMAVVACLIGCGSTPSSTSTPAQPPAVTEGDTLVDHLRAERDDICACVGHDCVEDVEDVMKHWRDRHRPALAKRHVASTTEQQQLEAEIARCAPMADDKLQSSSMMAAMVHFTDAMCACAYRNDPTCGKPIADEMTRWVAEHPEHAETKHPPTDEETRLGTKLAECTVKAMMAAMPPPP